MELTKLHQAIEALCPIEGICSDGRIDFKTEATPEQRANAEATMGRFLENPKAFKSEASEPATLEEKVGAMWEMVAESKPEKLNALKARMRRR